MFVLGVIPVSIFTAFSRITECLSLFNPNAGKCGKNADENNSEYEHFLHSDFVRIRKLELELEL